MNSKFLYNIYSLKINKTIKVLITSYSIVWSGWGMISPILAVFMLEKVQGTNIETVGFAISIYMITKSLVQLPVARYLDSKKGEKDEFLALFLGSFLLGVSAIGYINLSSITMLFVFQIVYGLGEGLLYPSWASLFSVHADRGSMATEYGIYYTTIDITSALSASLGALLVSSLGYSVVFSTVAVLSFLGAFTLIPMYKDLKAH